MLEHRGSVDLASVGYLREQVRRLDEQYDRVPSTALIPEAGQYLGQISFLGSHARRSYVRRELHAAEAETATLMGQLVWDASQRRDHETAASYFDQAVRAAQERGGKAAEGLALLRKSDPAIDLFSPSQPGRLAGSCYLFLQDAKSAAGILEETARELQDQSKSQAAVLGNLALTHIRLGALDASKAGAARTRTLVHEPDQVPAARRAQRRGEAVTCLRTNRRDIAAGAPAMTPWLGVVSIRAGNPEGRSR